MKWKFWQKAKTRTPEEVRALWAEELRAGKYNQVDSVLTETNAAGQAIGHCCLGVLCELYQREVGDLKVENSTVLGFRIRRTYDGADKVLPPKVQDWAGLSTPEGSYGMAGALSADNDEGKSFTTIADTIEERF